MEKIAHVTKWFKSSVLLWTTITKKLTISTVRYSNYYHADTNRPLDQL